MVALVKADDASFTGHAQRRYPIIAGQHHHPDAGLLGMTDGILGFGTERIADAD